MIMNSYQYLPSICFYKMVKIHLSFLHILFTIIPYYRRSVTQLYDMNVVINYVNSMQIVKSQEVSTSIELRNLIDQMYGYNEIRPQLMHPKTQNQLV